MKKYILLFALLLVGETIYAAAPPLECYKAAMADDDVLAQHKKDTLVSFPQNQENILANRVAALCANAATADGPINCYKSAMSDESVFADMKRLASAKYAIQPRRDLEDAIVNICRPANTFTRVE